MKTLKETQHTPTPWNVDRIGNQGAFLITSRERKIAVNAVKGGAIKDIQEDRANMEFIVCAVNSHAALIDALQRAKGDHLTGTWDESTTQYINDTLSQAEGK